MCLWKVSCFDHDDYIFLWYLVRSCLSITHHITMRGFQCVYSPHQTSSWTHVQFTLERHVVWESCSESLREQEESGVGMWVDISELLSLDLTSLFVLLCRM